MLLVNQCWITQRVEFSAVPYQCSSRAANAAVFLDLRFQYLNHNGICVIAVFWLPTHVTVTSSLPAPETNITPARLPIWTIIAQTNRGAAWKHGGLPAPHFPDLLTIGSHRLCGWGGGGEVARTVFVWTKNGSGLHLQPQHTPAWLSASERRVPLLRRLRRNSSCGSAADVCGDTAAAR